MKKLVLALTVVLLGARSLQGTSAPLNRIQQENRQPGTTAWQLTSPADNRQIEGYASLTSVPVGGNINLFVNTKDATYALTVYRMGWYSGKGGRKVLGPQLLAGVPVEQSVHDPRPYILDERRLSGETARQHLGQGKLHHLHRARLAQRRDCLPAIG